MLYLKEKTSGNIMKNFSKILFIFLLSLKIHSSLFAQENVFLKQVEFKLDFISENEYENEYFLTLKFTKGVKYTFKVNNHIEDYAGEAVVNLLDGDNLVMTNSISGKYYEQFAFMCNKTGFYDILIRFKDKKLGHSTLDIYMTQ